MMDFEQLIVELNENVSEAKSPLWIWFNKEEAGATCKMCKTNISRKDGSTGGLVNHLKRHHNFVVKYNAFLEISSLKVRCVSVCVRAHALVHIHVSMRVRARACIRMSDWPYQGQIPILRGPRHMLGAGPPPCGNYSLFSSPFPPI